MEETPEETTTPAKEEIEGTDNEYAPRVPALFPNVASLIEKMTQCGYPDFETRSGEEQVLMVYVADHLICGVDYALSLPEEHLKALIDETVRGA